MKNFLSVGIFAVLCFHSMVAQAVTHSTQENFNHCFKMCVSAINETADYSALINNSNYDVAVIRRQDCEILQDSLEFFWHNGGAQGAESLTLMLETIIIIQERSLTLFYYMDAVNAYRANKMNLYEEYIRKMYSYYNNAEQMRQEFRNKYGY